MNRSTLTLTCAAAAVVAGIAGLLGALAATLLWLIGAGVWLAHPASPLRRGAEALLNWPAAGLAERACPQQGRVHPPRRR